MVLAVRLVRLALLLWVAVADQEVLMVLQLLHQLPVAAFIIMQVGPAVHTVVAAAVMVAARKSVEPVEQSELFGQVVQGHSLQLARPMSKNNFLGKNHESLY
jgi:hypothetical protein